MNVYTILFYLNENTNHEHGHTHEHGDDCGCGHDHSITRDDYDIVATIKTLGSWANFMPDSYLVKSEFNAEEIKNKIESVLLPGDLLFVTKVDKEDVASLTPGVVDWIKAN